MFIYLPIILAASEILIIFLQVEREREKIYYYCVQFIKF